MKTIFYSIVLLSISVLISCSLKQKEVREIDALAKQIDSLIDVAKVLDPESRMKADNLVEKYVEFSEEYPNDSLAPVYLMKAAFLAGNIPEIDRQLELFEKVAEKYPDTQYAPQALALAAKGYMDNQNNMDKARRCLEKLQRDYPESVYSVNIDLQIQYLGDDDGLFEAIMERNAMNDSINAMKKGTGQ